MAVALILLFIFVVRKEDQPKLITMTTAKAELKIGLGGSGFATIDWGDGTPRETKTFGENDMGLVFDYKYENDTLHTITITGDNITSLICNENQLKTLNISGLTKLGMLHCADNELTSLNMSKLFGLRKLHCYNNQLTSLNVSGLTKLEYFACRGNQLTSLNINKHGNLNFLDCGENYITAGSLDTLLTSLPIVSSGTLDISSNGLERDGSGTNECNKSIAVAKGWTVYD